MLSKFLKSTSVMASSYYLIDKYYSQNYCCGIIGYIGHQKIADQIVAEGINLLQNRGYDSSGIATIENNTIHIDKMIVDLEHGIDCIDSIIKVAKTKHKNRSIGIGHTRWATCGEINTQNAHPHTDDKNRIALVHNGTIYNYQKLKDNLKSKGHVFKSETDTEVIAVLIGSFLDEGLDLINAVKESCQLLDGTWGLVIIHKDFPQQLICGRKGSPLVIGYTDEALYVSSESIAFSKYTNQIMRLEDRELILISLEKNIKDSIKERLTTIDQVEIKEIPSENFRSFFEEEIWEQPEAIKRALNFYKRLVLNLGTSKLGGFEINKQKALEIDNMILSGCGSSFNACLYGMHLFKVFEIFNTVECVVSSDFFINDLPKTKTGIICISQSGESADVINQVKMIKDYDKNIPIIGITNVVGSLFTTFCDWGVFCNSGREISVGATKSFSTQIVILYLIALWYSYHKKQDQFKFERNIAVQIFSSLPFLVKNCLEHNKQRAFQLAEILLPVKSLFVLGKGNAFPFAREMALKIKELCYIHAEAILAGELKHGPLAMIDSNYEFSGNPQTIVIVIVLDNNFLD